MNNQQELIVGLNPKDIPFITKIFEGFEGLALVTTLDGKQGLIKLNITPKTRDEVLQVLQNFPKKLKIY